MGWKVGRNVGGGGGGQKGECGGRRNGERGCHFDTILTLLAPRSWDTTVKMESKS